LIRIELAKIGNILRFFIFNNRCAICRKKLSINSNKTCDFCINNLYYISSLKSKNSRFFLWSNNKNLKILKRFSKNKNSSIFKGLDNIRVSKYRDLLEYIDINFFEYD
jgi:hypothetical protein